MKKNKTIAFFITDTGFGHIMRNLPVIKWLLLNTNCQIVLVSGTKQVEAAKNYLHATIKSQDWPEQLTLVIKKMEPGIILEPGTLEIDWTSLKSRLDKYFKNFPMLSDWTQDLIKSLHVDLIVSDIVPWVFPAANKSHVKSVLMASYTWIEEYAPTLGATYTQPFIDCYQLASETFLYALATKQTRQRFGGNAVSVGLVARETNSAFVKKIQNQYSRKPIVFVSMGFRENSLQKQLDVSQLPYRFITTWGVGLIGDNVSQISAAASNTQDYLAASNYAIIKAGWTTIAEGLLEQKKLLLLERPDAVEDSEYIRQLTERHYALSVSQSNLNDILGLSEILEQARLSLWKKPDYPSGTEQISKRLIDL